MNKEELIQKLDLSPFLLYDDKQFYSLDELIKVLCETTGENDGYD